MFQLPYLIDGEVKLVQSGAIMRHIARKHDLLGQTPEEQDRVDLVDAEINDLRATFTGMCYNPDFVSQISCSMTWDVDLK